jgi:transposase
MEKATIIGIDLAKRVFQVHAASKDGRANRLLSNRTS